MICVNFDTYLVDNGSTDCSVEYVRRSFPSVKQILNVENLGFAPEAKVAHYFSGSRKAKDIDAQ